MNVEFSPSSAAPASSPHFCTEHRGEEGLMSPVSLTGGEGTLSVEEYFHQWWPGKPFLYSALQSSLLFIRWRCSVGVADILTVEELSPRSRLCVRLSVQLLLQLNVQLSGIKGCSAVSLLGTDPTCLEAQTKMKISLGHCWVGSYLTSLSRIFLRLESWRRWVLLERVMVVTPHTLWYICSSLWREWTKVRLSLSCCWRTLTSCCSLLTHVQVITVNHYSSSVPFI